MLTQKIALSYSTKIILQIIQMATSLIVARLVGPNVLGILAYAMAFVSLFMFIADLGIGSAHIKLISGGHNEANCISTFAVLKTFLTICFVLTVLIVLFFQKHLLNSQNDDKDTETVIYIYLITYTVLQFSNIFTTTFAAKTEQAKQDIPNFIQTILYQIFRIILAVLGFKAIALALSNLAAGLLIFPIYFFLFRTYKFGKFDWDLARKYIRISLPIIIIVIAQTIIFSVDKILLKYFCNTTEVGYYSAGYTLSSFIRVIETSSGVLFFAFFSKNISDGNIDKVNMILIKFERFSLLLILPVVIFSGIFSKYIILLAYGKSFANAAPVFTILLLTFFCSLFYLPYGNILFANMKFRLAAIIWGISVLIFVAFSWGLTNPSLLNLKGIGISLSLLVTNIFIALAFIISCKGTDKNIIIFSGKKGLLFAGIYTSLYIIIFEFLKSSNIYILLVEGLIFFLGYWMISYSIKIYTMSDWKVLFDLINIKKIYLYIRKEVFKNM